MIKNNGKTWDEMLGGGLYEFLDAICTFNSVEEYNNFFIGALKKDGFELPKGLPSDSIPGWIKIYRDLLKDKNERKNIEECFDCTPMIPLWALIIKK